MATHIAIHRNTNYSCLKVLKSHSSERIIENNIKKVNNILYNIKSWLINITSYVIFDVPACPLCIIWRVSTPAIIEQSELNSKINRYNLKVYLPKIRKY